MRLPSLFGLCFAGMASLAAQDIHGGLVIHPIGGEGGEMKMVAHPGYAGDLYQDVFQDSLRTFWISSRNKRLTLANFGTGSATLDVQGPLELGANGSEGGELSFAAAPGHPDGITMDVFGDQLRIYSISNRNKKVTLDNYGSGTATFEVNGAINANGNLQGDYVQSDGNMYVAGIARAAHMVTSSMKIDLFWTTAPPADYVFEPDYKLMPLHEVESFVVKHRHLPGVPSAKEQIENGIDLYPMINKHLEKIEELTLHLIQAEKERDAAQERVEAMEQRLLALEEMVLNQQAQDGQQ